MLAIPHPSMNVLSRSSYRAYLALASLVSIAPKALANNGSLPPPPSIPGIPGGNSLNLKDAIVKAIAFVLDFLALIAVVFIIIAGVRLIVSQGDEGERDKAKKTILYVVIGLIVVILARVIVNVTVDTAPGIFGIS